MNQPDLFARAAPVRPQSDLPDPAEVRRDLHAKLAELTAAERMPWTERDQRLWRILVPQMSRWLPEERDDLIARFNAEYARLSAN